MAQHILLNTGNMDRAAPKQQNDTIVDIEDMIMQPVSLDTTSSTTHNNLRPHVTCRFDESSTTSVVYQTMATLSCGAAEQLALHALVALAHHATTC